MATQLKELEAFGEWLDVIERLKEVPEQAWNESIDPGKWSYKDVVSHIMRWDKYFYEEAIARIAADEPLTVQHLNYDDFNREAAEVGRSLSIAELAEQAIYYRKVIVDTIQKLPEEKLEKEYVDGDGHIFHIPTYLNDFNWHDQHHLKDINQLFV